MSQGKAVPESRPVAQMGVVYDESRDNLHQNRLDRLVGAIVGWVSGFRESWDQAMLGSEAICEGSTSCRVQWQAALGPS